jgi:hypothetical protein
MEGSGSPTQQNPLVSRYAAADPGASRYLVDVPGSGWTLVTIREAQDYARDGHEVPDPETFELADVLPTPTGSDEEREREEDLEEEEDSEKSGK